MLLFLQEDIDLRFKNNFRKPIFITQQVYEDRIVSTIYGDKEYKKDIEIVTEVVDLSAQSKNKK